MNRVIALSAVDPTVAEGLEVGALLEVVLNDQRYPVVMRTGQVLGMLVTSPMPTLVRCLSENGPFAARVVECEETLIRVRLERS